MSVMLTLRERESHAGISLVHPTSESVVLANVFGIVKNLPPDAVLTPWLDEATGGIVRPGGDWACRFWEGQPPPPGVPEGRTEVDLEVESERTLVFVEVKMDAGPSPGPVHDPDRNQLVRSLDVGHARASGVGKEFALVYVTPDEEEPAIVREIRQGGYAFPANRCADPEAVARRLFWRPWGSIADALVGALEEGGLSGSEQRFALDLVAYLRVKRLWGGALPERLRPALEAEKIYRALCADAGFIPYARARPAVDESWRANAWTEVELRDLLPRIGHRGKALLKLLADAGGAMTQGEILRRLPFLGGSTGVLRSVKNEVSKACKGEAKAPLLAVGVGADDLRVHEISPALGGLRDVVIACARAFVIPEGLRAVRE